uniref:Ig-like domain-containing protein n=1 Tax=Cyprinus carpio TaxID=7962 RepID=A0A8C2CCZ4_CYPCA
MECLFTLCANYLTYWHFGVYCQVVLTQSEQSVVVSPGASYKLTCACSGFTVSSTYMHWIRQAPGKGLEWILHYYSDSDKDCSDKLKSRFQIARDISSNTVTLRGQNMQTEDTSVYYCAKERAHNDEKYISADQAC